MRDFGLQAGGDEEVWSHAAAEGFAVVTKDDDFRQRSFLYGPPPKVVWVRLGNCRTVDIESVLRDRRTHLEAFEADPEAALLVLAR